MFSLPVVRWLGAGASVLVLGHLAGFVFSALGFSRGHGVLRQFDLNAEANLAAWSYAALLLLAGAVAGVLALDERARASTVASRWTMLSALLVLMSVDEVAQLHDMATAPLRKLPLLGHGIFYYAWLVPALVFLAWAARYFLPLVRSLEPVVAARLVLAAGLYFGGAVGVEMVSGVALAAGRGSFAYQASMTVEEVLELVGLVVAVGTLLLLAARRGVRVTVRFDQGRVALEPGQPARSEASRTG